MDLICLFLREKSRPHVQENVYFIHRLVSPFTREIVLETGITAKLWDLRGLKFPTPGHFQTLNRAPKIEQNNMNNIKQLSYSITHAQR